MMNGPEQDPMGDRLCNLSETLEALKGGHSLRKDHPLHSGKSDFIEHLLGLLQQQCDLLVLLENRLNELKRSIVETT